MDPALDPLHPRLGGDGRDRCKDATREINAFDLLVARAKAGHHDRGMILSGLRGVGKTALLNHLCGHAEVFRGHVPDQ